jgi:hypothetical protein
MKTLIRAIEDITGDIIEVDFDKQTLQVYHSDGNRGMGACYKSSTELQKYLLSALYGYTKKTLSMLRVRDAVEKGNEWTELFEVALEDGGWNDSQELADAAGVPQAKNIRVVKDEDEDGYW